MSVWPPALRDPRGIRAGSGAANARAAVRRGARLARAAPRGARAAPSPPDARAAAGARGPRTRADTGWRAWGDRGGGALGLRPTSGGALVEGRIHKSVGVLHPETHGAHHRRSAAARSRAGVCSSVGAGRGAGLAGDVGHGLRLQKLEQALLHRALRLLRHPRPHVRAGPAPQRAATQRQPSETRTPLVPRLPSPASSPTPTHAGHAQRIWQAIVILKGKVGS